MTHAERINQTLEAMAWEYGKIGLLIDDSPEFLMRVARALYGAEALPKWWIAVRSVECGAAALSQVSKLLDDRAFGPLRVFILIDRYLPLQCGGGPAIAWHGGDSESVPAPVSELNGCVAAVMKRADEKIDKKNAEGSKCLIRFVTSFPVVSVRVGDAPGIVWHMRSVELLQEERQEFEKSGSWRCVLHYGPEDRARIVEEKPPDWMAKTADAARWRAVTWSQTLSRLAKIVEEKRAILLTGAGASLSAGAAGPGMLRTGEIVDRVCRSMDNDGYEEPLPRPEVATCSCMEPKEPVKSSVGHTSAPKSATPIGRLLAREEHEFKLEEVFSPERHKTNPAQFRSFHQLFRRELYKRDFGCAFHHWLMARFPWKAIITTNFDGFHERASAAVARILAGAEEARLWVLSLGSVGRPEDLRAKPQAARGLGKSRLFKPYGSLYSPTGELALGERDVEAFQDELEKALSVVLNDPGNGGRGALVVVGQSMRDELVRRALENLKGKLQHCELIWVDPDAYKRCRLIERSKSSLWERWVEERMDERKLAVHGGAKQVGDEACSGPVPATALEFIYDLWMVSRKGGE